MNDIELALEDLDNIVEDARVNKSMVGFLNKVHSANTMKEALEKQIPKQVKELDKEYGYFICNTCDHYINYSDDYESHKYCLNCGQKLDWTSL